MEDGHELKYDGYDPKDPESMIALSLRQNVHLDHSLLLSSLIQKQFKERVGRPDRGVKQAGFLVISYTTMPSVLIELGFLTNANGRGLPADAPRGRTTWPAAIYRAFKEYKAIVEGNGRSWPAVADAPVVVEPSKPVEQPKPVHGTAGVRFKVQIVTSSKRIEPKPKNFNGLEGVEEHKGAGLYKYTRGRRSHAWTGRGSCKRRCKDKGFDGAFIVAFKDGNGSICRKRLNWPDRPPEAERRVMKIKREYSIALLVLGGVVPAHLRGQLPERAGPVPEAQRLPRRVQRCHRASPAPVRSTSTATRWAR